MLVIAQGISCGINNIKNSTKKFSIFNEIILSNTFEVH